MPPLLDFPKQKSKEVHTSGNFGARIQGHREHSQLSDDHVIIGAEETENSYNIARNNHGLQDELDVKS